MLIVPQAWASLLRADELGVAALLPKPFDVDALLTTLRRVYRANPGSEPAPYRRQVAPKRHLVPE